MIDIGTLAGRITLDDHGSAALKAFAGNVSDIGSGLTSAGTALTLGITVPIAALGLGSIKLASDFESSFAGVRKTVDASEPELQRLAQSFRDMSKEIPVSVNELNRIAEAGGQLGVKTADLEGFTRTMAAMGEATNLSSDEAATSLAQIANIINDKAGPQYDRLGATIVALGNAGASTEKDITEFGLRLAGAGKVAGLTQPEILSIGSALASVGINAEAGGTAFSKVFMMMTQAAAQGASGVKSFAAIAGVSADQFAKTFKEKPAEAITQFVEGLGRINTSGGDLFGTLDSLGISEARMRDSLLRASGAGDLLRESIETGNKAWIDNTALTAEAEQRYKTTASQLSILWNRIQDVGITLGQAFIPIMMTAFDALSPVIDALASAANWFGKLPAPIQGVAVVVGVLLAGLGPMLMIIGSIATGVAAVTPLFGLMGLSVTGVGITVAALAGPLTLAIGIVGGLYLALKHFDLLNPIIEFFQDMGTVVRGLLVEAFKMAAPYVSALAGFIGNQLLSAIKNVTAPLVTVIGWVKSFGAAISDFLMPYLKSARDQLGFLADKFREGSGPVELADRGLKTYRQSLEDFKNPLIAVTGLTDGMTQGTGKAIDAGKKFVPQTKAQADAAEDYAKKLSDVNKKIADATRDVGNLTGAQKDAVLSYDDLGLSISDIAVKLGISELAVADYKKEVELTQSKHDDWIKKMKDAREAAEKLAPALGGIGFKIAHEDVTLLKGSVGGLNSGLTIAGDSVRVAVPLFGTVLPKAVSDASGKIKEGTADVKAHKTELEVLAGVLGGLGSDFTQMAQIAGDSFSPILRWAGEAIKSVEMLVKVMDRFDKLSSGAEGGFTAANIASMATGIVGAALAFWSILDSLAKAAGEARKLAALTAFGEAIAKQLETSTRFSNQLEHELADLHDEIIGLNTTDLTAIIESFLGLEHGIQHTAEENMKILIAWNELSGLIPEALKLPQIVAELGGVAALTASQLKTVHNRAELLFTVIEVGGVFGQRAISTLNESLVMFANEAMQTSGLVDQFFIDMVAQAKAAGIELDGVNEFILGKLKSGAESLNSTLIGLQDSATASAQKQAKLVGDLTDEEIDTLVGTFTVTEAQGAGLAAAVAANFAEMVERGMTFREAIDALQPSIDILKASLNASGVDGGAAFAFLTEMSRIANDAIMGPLTDAITGANNSLKNLHNSGILNQQMFTGLELTAVQAYQKIIAEGGDGNAAMMMMQPTLQTLWSMHRDFGYTVDDATQGLLDEAEAAGTVGDAHRPVADQMLLATKGIQAAVEGLARVFGVVLPASAETAAKGVNDALNKIVVPKVEAPWHDWEAPPEFDGRTDNEAAGLASGGVVYAATGRVIPFIPRGTDTVPAMLTPGEGVVTVEGMSRIGGEAGLNAINNPNAARSSTHDDETHQEIVRLRKDISTMTRVLKSLPRANKIAMEDAALLVQRRA